MQVDGLVMLGSGSAGQITGLYPQGTITGGSTPGIIVNSATDDHDFQWIELVLFPLVGNNLQSGIISRAETDALVKRIVVEAHCPAPCWADVWHKPTVRNVIDRSKITDADCTAAAVYSAKKPKAR